jgi:hypothetical protein
MSLSIDLTCADVKNLPEPGPIISEWKDLLNGLITGPLRRVSIGCRSYPVLLHVRAFDLVIQADKASNANDQDCRSQSLPIDSIPTV